MHSHLWLASTELSLDRKKQHCEYLILPEIKCSTSDSVVCLIHRAGKNGNSGLWQVQARQDSSFAKYIALDTAYVENWSFWLDLKILVRTAEVVVRGTGT
ncbi:sugar transferase [Acidipila sp. 4G-K13]|uniref:Bacterial sugar transferase domain-containing protein n=1 Tax=Paracidobacterium acidisoli TaxID=2303751 RepID=A0A372IRG6_9BACT|nr:sugar transferase [Paracidobacterium acidisoli]